ncbi:sucrose phosphorylase [Isoptericola sp. b515]|uniref:sucrose phosphorylase n=1 Tax=Isoptericola sp. b515 TaxID=3064652 RepID=UPI0027123981|nr:sucrose phosphorylase [Isoptericola sp. b515]MDO8147768.1 sucrose phosphorylase [Isoptericola sp. b515]
MGTQDQVQLIAYADRLGGDLRGLARFLRRDEVAESFGGVHVLPFYTPFDGADAGFDPVDHTAVDPRLGTWDDVRDLSRTHDVMVDLIVNHVSADSAAFRDVVAHGDASPWAPMFLTMSSVFPDGAREEELARIYRPRPGLPFTALRLGDTLRYVWTTFTPQQIDIDLSSELGQDYLTSILDTVAAAGVRQVRLDAVGYAVKTPGSTCFMTPETFAFIADFAARARERGVDVLVEVHSYYRRQIEIAREVDLVYDFALPPLVLHALYTGDGAALLDWLRERPRNAVTVLDTHDGIGVIDVGPDQTVEPGEPERPGLLDPAQIDALVEGIHERTGGASAAATGAAASNLDLYQVNSTFYDALGRDDARYLAARALQLFTPGIPQVYYVGLLAGENDVELLQRTGVGRDINRHHYTAEEIDAALDTPVVRRMLALCRFRNTFPAFDGDVDATLDGTVLSMERRGVEVPDAVAVLEVDLASGVGTLTWSSGGRGEASVDLAAFTPDDLGGPVGH